MQNIDISIKPSKQFIALLLLALITSLGVILIIPLSLWHRLLLIMLVITYSAWIVKSHGLIHNAHSILKLQLLSKGLCRLYYPGYFIEGTIRGDSTVTIYLSILRFSILALDNPKNKSRIVSCVLFRDSMDKTSYRQLLLWLRCVNPL